MQYPVDTMTTGSFAGWFNHQLKRRKWSQADFHRATDIARSTISTWATGLRIPDPASCEAIASAFHVSPALVLEKAGHFEAEEEIDPSSAAGHVVALIKLFNQNEDFLWDLASMLTGRLERQIESQNDPSASGQP